MALALNDVIEKKSSIDFKTQAFINGNYINSITGKTFESISPVDGSLIANVSECDVKDINNAVLTYGKMLTIQAVLKHTHDSKTKIKLNEKLWR